jgi:hypothetical protein
MSETQETTPGTTEPPTPSAAYWTATRPEPTGWIGWVIFAGVMMILLGAFEAIMGLVALFDDGYYLVTRTGLVVSANFTQWGWTHLILGVIAVVAGFGVMLGQTWARVVGVILAVVSALVNVAFLAAYPVWSTLVITLDVIVIYALAVHGSETKA